MTQELSSPAETLARLAHEAGALILKHYGGSAPARTKADFSPVTAADEEAEAHILTGLSKTHPGVPVIAEEAMTKGPAPKVGDAFFLVDPLDGTKEFLSQNGEFTVNIALIRHGKPVLGIVYAPALDRMFTGEIGHGAFEIAAKAGGAMDVKGAKPLHARKAPAGGLVAAISRTHGDTKTDEYLSAYAIANLITAGSSLKFCLIAAGEADLYPRHGPTMEWDTAAGHAVVNAAGGTVTKLDGSPFLYGKAAEGFRNPGFVAKGLA